MEYQIKEEADLIEVRMIEDSCMMGFISASRVQGIWRVFIDESEPLDIENAELFSSLLQEVVLKTKEKYPGYIILQEDDGYCD